MSVTKIIQKQSIRPRKLKYTMANADSIEMAILPSATVTAITALLSSIRPMFDLRHASA